MNKFDLIIFDCDGVLVDSERITNQVFCDMLNEIGVPVSLEDMFERFVGLSMPQCVEVITELHGAPPPAGFIDELKTRSEKALKEHIVAVPGVPELLTELNIPYCVASSGSHEKIRLTLGETGLLKYFKGQIFSVTDVARPKPAPDIFLHAAQTFDCKANRCVVVEDTPTGVRAAAEAGMHIFGYTANTPAHRLNEAGVHQTFTTMQHLAQMLRKNHNYHYIARQHPE